MGRKLFYNSFEPHLEEGDNSGPIKPSSIALELGTAIPPTLVAPPKRSGARCAPERLPRGLWLRFESLPTNQFNIGINKWLAQVDVG